MNLESVIAVLLSLSAIGYLALGIRLMAATRRTGNSAMSLLFLVIGIWVAGSAVELFSTSFMQFSAGRTMHFFGTAFLPIVAYTCFREYVGAETPNRIVVLLVVIPVVSVTLAATNQFHEFMWFLPSTNEAGQFLTRPVQWGPWFLYVHAPFSYAMMTIAVLTLVARGAAVATVHRRALFLLALACVPPLSATVAYDFGIGSNTISYVPIVFAAMLPVYAWLVYGERIIESSPLAYETVFHNMQDPVVVLDDTERVIGLNRGALEMLKVSEGEALKTQLDEVFGDGSTCVFEVLKTGEPQKMLTNSGRFLHVQASVIESGGNSVSAGKVLMFRDVSALEHAQSKVRDSEQLLRTLIEHSVNGIIRLRWFEQDDGERELRCIFANATAVRFLDEDLSGLIDSSVGQILKVATSGMDIGDADAVLAQFTRAAEARRGLDVEVRQRYGSSGRWLRMICEPVGDDFAATLVDVTDGKARERHIESIAWQDPLTGVLNRRGFERDASKRLSESEDDATGALLYIDLNDFKQVNDERGHEVGDQLLTIAAARLRKSLRSCDIIGRPGGDEFVALVPDVSADTAEKLAKRLTSSLEEPYVIGTEQLLCAASIGLALYPRNANTLTGLLREADQAMYRAKARSRDFPDDDRRTLLEKAI